ncbi:hypothetical protein PENTCL1PPCAC_21754, partial [Pristionchus entomophagus]
REDNNNGIPVNVKEIRFELLANFLSEKIDFSPLESRNIESSGCHSTHEFLRSHGIRTTLPLIRHLLLRLELMGIDLLLRCEFELLEYGFVLESQFVGRLDVEDVREEEISLKVTVQKLSLFLNHFLHFLLFDLHQFLEQIHEENEGPLFVMITNTRSNLLLLLVGSSQIEEDLLIEKIRVRDNGVLDPIRFLQISHHEVRHCNRKVASK